jgi:hypothetical protein
MKVSHAVHVGISSNGNVKPLPDPNREILNLYQYPTSATQLLHIYGIGLGRSTSLPESRVGALRALIGSTLNLAVGDVGTSFASHSNHSSAG